MLSEIQKLLDRNFAIGFVLPAMVLISVSGLLLSQYVFNVFIIDFASFEETDFLVFTTSFGLLSWVGGIILMAINREVYRLMEGYGSVNPLKLFGWFERQRYQHTRDEFIKLDSSRLKAGEGFPVKLRNKCEKLGQRLAVEFPERKEFLLPTPFGNVLRSFESYPRVMYGLDSIPAWGRLLAVIPRDYIVIMNAVKAQVDFWVNLGLVFILLQIEYLGLVFVTESQLNWLIVGFWIVLGTIALSRATGSAREWGHFVKSAFDLFAPKLREALGIEEPENRQEEFAQWVRISRALIYRLPKELPELKKAKTGKNPPRISNKKKGKSTLYRRGWRL